MYSISDLNDEKLSIVCKVPDIESYYKLRVFCPHMYDDLSDYYLTSRCGRGNYNAYHNDTDAKGSPYILITMEDIDWDNIYECDYSNGIPLIWGDEI